MVVSKNTYIFLSSRGGPTFSRGKVGMPAIPNLNGVLLAGRLWPTLSGIWILPPLINKKNIKNGKV